MNCPNCGAPIEGERCAYCGSLFVDFAAMDAEHPFYMKIKDDNNVYVFKVILRSVDIHRDYMEYVSDYSSNKFAVPMDFGELTIDLSIIG